MPNEVSEVRLLNLIKRKPVFKQDFKKIKLRLGDWMSNREFLAASHKVLKMILLGLIGCFILSFIFPLFWKENLEKLAVSDSRPEESLLEEVKTEVFEAENYEVYLKDIASKQLFETNFAEEALQAETEVNLSEKFSLVGIISGDSPQAVIEDKEAQKTYYLRAGESLGGIKLEAINEGKARINFRGRQAELFL